MKKLLFVFLSIIINFSILPAQSIEGNFELDSLVVNYTLVARDMVQTGNDGAEYTTTYDDSAGTYEVLIGWPVAGENSVFDFALPILKYGGHFVTKLFQGVGVEEMIELVRPHFQTVKRFSPMASRNSSSEVYLVCKFHTPKRGPDWHIRPAFEYALENRKGGPEPLVDVEPAQSTFSIRKKSIPED